MQSITILGIETSCDETAASLVRRHPAGSGEILSNIVRTQVTEHAAFGGVVPEIAARAHSEILDRLIIAALEEAGVDLKDTDAIAATAGPGLIGGLLVGTVMARAIAKAAGKPYIPINHLEGHALTVGLTHGQKPPYLLLLVSGGHTQLIWVRAVGAYKRIGSTIDDALGEAFDKTAKLLGLGYPGGPVLEKWALDGQQDRFDLPTPLKGAKQPNFSFSGLKTALRQKAEQCAPLNDQDIHDLCASFQKALITTVIDRLNCGIEQIKTNHTAVQFPLVVAGGVAANKALRQALQKTTSQHGLDLIVPPAELCTDNAAMIAWAGAERLALNGIPIEAQRARSRWPLDETAQPLLGSGKAGAKA